MNSKGIWGSSQSVLLGVCSRSFSMRAPVLFVKTVLVCVLGLSVRLTAEEPSETARRLNEAFVQVAEKVSPAVVVINVVEKPSEPTEGDEPEKLPRGFRPYFHDPSDERPEK